MSDTLRIGRSRGIPLEIISRVASRNGVLESLAKSNNVIDIRHLQLMEFVRVSRSLGASWVQIGDSLGIGARAACKQFGEPLEDCTNLDNVRDLTRTTRKLFELVGERDA